jgi:hypothetical protein
MHKVLEKKKLYEMHETSSVTTHGSLRYILQAARVELVRFEKSRLCQWMLDALISKRVYLRVLLIQRALTSLLQINIEDIVVSFARHHHDLGPVVA